jgi:hypothetical protein
MFSSSLNLVRHSVKTITFEPPQCKNCKHFVLHTGPVPFPPTKNTAIDLGKCKLLGYYAITCRTHWLSTISCGKEGRLFEPK